MCTLGILEVTYCLETKLISYGNPYIFEEGLVELSFSYYVFPIGDGGGSMIVVTTWRAGGGGY